MTATTNFIDRFAPSKALRERLKSMEARATAPAVLRIEAADGEEPQNTIAAVQAVALRYRQEVRFDDAFLVWRFEENIAAPGPVDTVFPSNVGVYDPSRVIVTGLPLPDPDPDSMATLTTVDDAVTGRARFHPSPGALEFWARTNSTGPDTIVRITGDTLDENLTVTLNLDGTVTVAVADSVPATLRDATSTVTVNNNQWRHVVINDDGTNLTIFIDGAPG